MLKRKRETGIVENFIDLFDLPDLRVKTLSLYFNIPFIFSFQSATLSTVRGSFTYKGCAARCPYIKGLRVTCCSPSLCNRATLKMPGLMTIGSLVCFAIIFVGNYQPWLAAFLGLTLWVLPYHLADWEVHLFNRLYVVRVQLPRPDHQLPGDAEQ